MQKLLVSYNENCLGVAPAIMKMGSLKGPLALKSFILIE